MNDLTLKQEVIRCLQCYNPPCSFHCPQGVEPANIIRSIYFDNIQTTFEKAESCILCGKCESYCIRSKLDTSIHIVDIMKHLSKEKGLK